MAFKAVRYKAEGIVNIWEAAEMGEGKAKKKYKRDIRRQRRVLEKRLVEKELNEYTNG